MKLEGDAEANMGWKRCDGFKLAGACREGVNPFSNGVLLQIRRILKIIYDAVYVAARSASQSI